MLARLGLEGYFAMLPPLGKAGAFWSSSTPPRISPSQTSRADPMRQYAIEQEHDCYTKWDPIDFRKGPRDS